MRKYLAVAVCALCPGIAANDLPPDVLLTARVLYANRQLINRLPLYTCLETITRSQPGKKRSTAKQDVVQVDVGVGADAEMYSWPGDISFSAKDLPALVGKGMLSTGLFHSFVVNIFGSNLGIVKAAGDGNLSGGKALHFTYTVPSLASRWDVNWMGVEGSVGEEGEFWVDPVNFTLLRLDTAAVDIPGNLRLRSVNTKIRYHLEKSGEEQVLMPEGAEVAVIQLDGTRYFEQVEFSHCHVFAAESSLSTAGEDLTKAITRYEAERGILPAGLSLQVSLETAVHADELVIGKEIYAVLREPVKLKNQAEIPAGARLKGHIREFQKMDEAPDTFLVGLEFDELTWPGHSAAFFANVTFVQPTPGVEFSLYKSQEQTVNLLAGRASRTTTTRTWTSEIPGVASFFLQGQRASLPKGLHMTWRTQELAHH